MAACAALGVGWLKGVPYEVCGGAEEDSRHAAGGE